MPLYTVKTPTGRFVKVNAPEGARDEDLFEYVMQNSPDPVMQASEPGFFGEMGSKVQAGMERGKAFLAGVLPDMPVDDQVAQGLGYRDGADYALHDRARAIAQSNRNAEAADRETMATTAARQNIAEAEGWWDTTKAIAENPRAVAATIAESLGMTAPVLAGAAASGGTMALPFVVGLGSGATEYAATLQDTMADRGVDLTDAGQVARALGNQELMAEARERGTKRGIAVGAFDALTAGLAGRLLAGAKGVTSTAARAAGEAGLQMGGGMAGEATAQLATEGRVTSPSDVLMEGFAEIPSAIAEVPGNYREARTRMAAQAPAALPPKADITTAGDLVEQTTPPKQVTVPGAGKPRISYEELVRQRDERARQREIEVAAGTVSPAVASVETMLDTARAERGVPLGAQERAQGAVAEATAASKRTAALAAQEAAQDAEPAAGARATAAVVEARAESLLDTAAAGTLSDLAGAATPPATGATPASPVAAAPAALPSATEPGAAPATLSAPSPAAIVSAPPTSPAVASTPEAPRMRLATPEESTAQDQVNVARALGAYGAALVPEQVQVVKLADPAQQRMADRLGKLLGRRVVFFDQPGETIAAAFANDGRNIYVNAEAINSGAYSPRALIGHEFVHTLRLAGSPLFKELAEFATPRINRAHPEVARTDAAYRDAYKGMGRKQLDAAVDEELIADRIGDLLDDDAFWAEMAEQNPSLFRKMLDEILAFLDQLMAKAKRLQAEDVFNEAGAMRAKAVDILRRHMEQTAQGQQLEEIADPFEKAATEYEQLVGQHESNPDMRAAMLAEVQQLRTQRDPALLKEVQEFALPDLRTRGGKRTQARLQLKQPAKTEALKKYETEQGQKAAYYYDRGEEVGAMRIAGQLTRGYRPAPLELDTPEKREFAKGADPSLMEGDRALRVQLHGGARDITRFRPKQGNAVFMTPSPEFAAPYSGSSMAFKKHSNAADNISVNGKSLNDTLNDPELYHEIPWHVAHLLTAVEGDIDRALANAENYVDDNGEGLQHWEQDELVAELEDIQARAAEDPDYLRVERAGVDTSGATTYPLVTNAKNIWDFEDPRDTNKLLDALRTKFGEDATAVGRAASQFGRRTASWDVVAKAIREGDWTFLEDPGIGVPGLLQKMGHDAYHVSEEGTKNLAVFDPRQIKSATGNVGTFGMRRPTAEEAASLGMTEEEAYAAQDAGDIRLFINRQGLQNGLAKMFSRLDLPERWAKFERAFLDEFRDLREIQKSVASQVFGSTVGLPEQLNAHRMENLRHGAYQDERKAALDRYVEPVAKILGKAGASMEEFADFLWWRHAPERDAYLRAHLGPGITAGPADLAGIDPQDALAKIAALPPAKRMAFEAAARHMDHLRQFTLKKMLDTGQITQERHDALRRQYQYYVPLRGKPNGDVDPVTGKSRGVSMTENPLGKRATGRKSKAGNIVEHMVSDMEASLVNGHKQNVLSALVRLIAANPDPKLWEIAPATAERKWVDGELRVVQGKGEAKDQLTFMHRGVPVKIEIRHEGLRNALLNMNTDNVPRLLRGIGRVTRWLSAVKTSFSPFFMLVNPVRDAGLATMALGAEHGLGTVRSAAKFYPRMVRALAFDARKPGGVALRAARMKGDPTFVRAVQYAREFAATGGKTGYTFVNDIREQQKSLERLMTKHAQSPGMKEILANGALSKDGALLMRKAWQGTANLFEVANDLAENITRLAVYAALREQGKTVQESAAYAKEVTVNFNRRGSIGKHLNNLYMFFNAAVQGSSRLAKLMGNKKFAATMGGLFASSYALALAQMMASGDDDDGENIYQKAVGQDGERSLPVYLSNGNTLNIPVPYGPNMFTHAGYRLAKLHYDMMQGKNPSVGDASGDILAQAISSLSPIDPGKGGQALLPEIARIPYQVATNTNDFGGRISPKVDPFERGDVAHYNETDVKTGGAYKALAAAMNRLTGGNAYEGGVANLTGEQIRYLTEQLTGGMGRLASQSYELLENLMADVDIEPSDVPLANVYYRGRSPEQTTATRYYDNLTDYNNTVDDWKLAIARNDEAKLSEILAKAPWVQGAETDASTTEGRAAQEGTLMQTERDVRRAVKSLRQQKDALYEDESLSTSERVRMVREIDQQIEQYQRAFNASMNAATRASASTAGAR